VRRRNMAKYFVFMNLTEKGAAGLDALQDDFDRALAAANHSLAPDSIAATTYALFGGPYDFVADCEAARFDDVAFYSLKLTETGDVRTTTPLAYDMAGFRNVASHFGKMAP
jgi:uncharacterized protein with GYD domain